MQKAIKSNSLVDQIYDVLKDSIITSELKPGDRIVELDLVKRYGVSQGPVREALSRLRKEKLVIQHRYKGTFVSNLSKEDIEEIYDLREIIEEFTIKRAVNRLTQKDLDELFNCIIEMEYGAKEKDINKIRVADKEFHNILYKSSDHKLVLEVWEELSTKSNRIWHLTKQIYFSDLHQVAQIHSPILQALRMRDEAMAVKEFRNHLNFVKKKFMKEV